jgi:subtilisin-like proprotein convertase family protein
MSETVEVTFGRKDETPTVLGRSDDLIAVRTRSQRSLVTGAPTSYGAAELADGQLVLAFPEAGVEVFRVPTGAGHKSVDDRKEALRRHPDVRFAGGVLVDQESGEPMIYTENLFVKFADRVTPAHCREVLRAFNLTIKEEVSYSTNAYFVAAPEGIGLKVFELAQALLARDDVEYCHPEIVRHRERRGIFPQQWHLKATTLNGVAINASANVEAAHRVTRGEGIVIAVIDDGVDIDHLEFNYPGKIVAPRDATLGTNDPRPKDPRLGDPENHGTACAGVACAEGKFGASGVAPQARLMPIRLVSGLGSQKEAQAFVWAADHGADVISCSWGPQDGRWYDPNDPLHNTFQPLPASTRLAIDYAIRNGRNGKGCAILFAAGNGNESVDNDGYASYDRVIAVAACNDRSKRSAYSDFGNAVWCAFPSNDFEFPPASHPAPLTPGIWTTDRMGQAGYNSGSVVFGDKDGNFTNEFGGTSSACPGAAGVVALILSVNPELKWHEVRDILCQAADKIDPQGGAYDLNGHSPYYGHGRLNAETAVRLATPAPRSHVRITRTEHTLLAGRQSGSILLTLGQDEIIDAISVSVEIDGIRPAELIVQLTPPGATKGKRITLHNAQNEPGNSLRRTFDSSNAPLLAALAGRRAKGIWKLTVENHSAQAVGVLRAFGVEYTARWDERNPTPA